MKNKLTDYGTERILTIDLTTWLLCGWQWLESDGTGYEIVERKPARS